VIVGAAGADGAVNVLLIVFDKQPEALVNVMLNDPSLRPEMVAGSVIPVKLPLDVPAQDRSPVPVPVISTEPLLMVQEVGLVTVPCAITGIAFTVTVVALLAVD
jgi:hypothetical protein